MLNKLANIKSHTDFGVCAYQNGTQLFSACGCVKVFPNDLAPVSTEIFLFIFPQILIHTYTYVYMYICKRVCCIQLVSYELF